MTKLKETRFGPRHSGQVKGVLLAEIPMTSGAEYAPASPSRSVPDGWHAVGLPRHVTCSQARRTPPFEYLSLPALLALTWGFAFCIHGGGEVAEWLKALAC